ncbi:hypothetical protein BGZ88_000429 [Linnemannia elongata]|nr:hypothetical protein BGZ88_000429 [Linnemannia elongata]
MLATMSALSWTNTASANIEFARTTLPNVNPGDPMTLNWNITTPPVGTVANTAPFNLVLRALSGQTYLIRANVAQELLAIRVNIPTNATGGKHSYLCDYTGSVEMKGISTGQFNISGLVIPTTSATRAPTSTGISVTLPSTTGTPGSNGENKEEGNGGLSSGALAGIIGGVVAFFLFIAAIFFFRHRRLVRERTQHTRLNDTKESIHEPQGGSGPVARSGPPPSGPPGHGHDGGMVPIPLGGPGHRSNEFQRNHSNEFGSPRSQHQMQHLGSPGSPNNSNGRNPFEGGSEDSMTVRGSPGGPNSPGMARSLSPRDQHQPYMPPQLNQGPPPRQQQPYGMPNGHPGMQQQRGQSPFQQSSRDSFESELESAYDPNQQARMMQGNNNYGGGNGPVQRNNSNAMMHSGGPLHHSSSSRSLNSNGPRQNNMPGSPLQQQQGNPFQDRELMAAAAGGIAAAHAHHSASNSPSMAHRQLPNQNQMSPSPRSQSPMIRAIEMQPLDVQQHQYEQQQRALQRAHPFNPTLYDDKTEVDDDGVPVYNGYRDTIFGAYVHTPGDDDDDESGSDDDRRTPVPTIPTAVVSTQVQQQQQQGKEEVPASTGGATIERKKSVKFTGVPTSGPIVVPGTTAAPAHKQQKPQQQMYHSGDDEEEDEDYEYEDADEEDIKLRLMETEVPSPSSAHSRPAMIDTSSPTAASRNAGGSTLSPIRTPTQAYNSSSSHYQQQSQQSPVHTGSPSRGFVAPPPQTTSTSQSDNFFDDVLAAVDNKSYQPYQAPAPTSPQHQQHIPPPQAQQLKQPPPLHVEQAVFGAPSPRIAPAAAPSNNGGHPSPPTRSGARLPPQQQQHQQQQYHQQQRQQQRNGADDEENAFYESSLL